MVQFKDYFSLHSTEYSKYRPRYPDELFNYLASVAPTGGTAWDCATGNGQAAHGLARVFQRVIATDASPSQIQNAMPHERISYVVATADHTYLDSCSIDLATVAQAVHWFDVDDFWYEVRRVLKPHGAIAVWCYNIVKISPSIDNVVREFYDNVVGPYWPPERRIVEDAYRSLSFPFVERQAPAFYMKAPWPLYDLLGYVRTWSATQNYIRDHGADPVCELEERILPLWGDAKKIMNVRWLLSLRVGIKDQ